MSFFSELSPIGKGAVVLGAVVLLAILVMYFGDFGLFGSPAGTTQTRGVQ